MAFVLLHNPQCSKSRAAKAMLEERGVDFQVREYLKQPLSLDELRILKSKLGLDAGRWLRWGESDVGEAGITPDDPPMRLLEAMAHHPRLIERPILISEDEAAVGRPGPEALEGLL